MSQKKKPRLGPGLIEYHGGKLRLGKQVAKFLAPIISKMAEEGKVVVVEPFCGMASTTCSMIQELADKKSFQNIYFVGNDYLATNIMLLRAIQRGELFPEQVTEAEFDYLRKLHKKKELAHTPRSVWIGFACTRGCFYETRYTPKIIERNYRRVAANRHLIQNPRVEFICHDYQQVRDYVETKYQGFKIVFVLDPPYQKRSSRNYYGDWRSQEKYDVFWNYVRTLSLTYPCIVHEYMAPDDFLPVWSGRAGKNREYMFVAPAPSSVHFMT